MSNRPQVAGRYRMALLLIPFGIIAVNVLTVMNLPLFDEGLEEPAAAAFHLLHDRPRFHPLLLTVAPFEGLGQAGMAVWIAALAAVHESYAAVKCAAVITQILVWGLWYLWARRLVPFGALVCASLFFVFPPDNYAGSMLLSNGHQAESLLFFLAALWLLERRRCGRGGDGWLGIVAGAGVAFYPTNLVLAIFLVAEQAVALMFGSGCRRHIVLFAAGVVAGYLPLALLFTGLGLSPWSQLTATDAWYTALIHDGKVRTEQVPVLAQTEVVHYLREPRLIVQKGIATAARLWISTADRYTYLPVQSEAWFRNAGAATAILALLGWGISGWRRGSLPGYVAGYLAVLCGAYLVAGTRYTVSLARPGEPGAFRYLLPLYPLLFTALGYMVHLLLRRSRGGIAVLMMTALVMFASYPTLMRCRYDAGRYGQVLALRLGYPATLGNAYYRKYGRAGLPAAHRQLARLAGYDTASAELAARGLAVATAAENGFPLAELAGHTFSSGEPSVQRGWWQGLGFCHGMTGGTPSAGDMTGEYADAFWYGVGHAYGYDLQMQAALAAAASAPAEARTEFWTGYGEAMTASVFRANADLYRAARRLDQIPVDVRQHATRGFSIGVERLTISDSRWSARFRAWFAPRYGT